MHRADQIVVLAHGRILEKGTHDELLQSEGAYAKLWRAQAPAGQKTFEALGEL